MKKPYQVIRTNTITGTRATANFATLAKAEASYKFWVTYFNKPEYKEITVTLSTQEDLCIKS